MPAVLTHVLATATNVPVHPFLKPARAGLPCLVYHRISDRVQDGNHAAGGSLHLSRVQIDHIASSAGAVFSMVTTVQNALEGNKSDFSCSMAADVHIERKDADDVFVVTKDYFIQWKAN